MLSIPPLTRLFAALLLALGLYLAVENTIISADVLGYGSGASVIASTAIAVVATGLELTFASWIRQEKSAVSLASEIKHRPIIMGLRLIGVGISLALVYHFDILTTARHPRFLTGDAYFFGVVVAAFVFGPEACIVISSWLWSKARDIETRQLDKDSIKDAENQRLKTRRSTLMDLSEQAGEAEAVAIARNRWGGNTSANG